MSFSFNESMVLSNNPTIEEAIKKVDTHIIMETMNMVIVNTVTLSDLEKEFKQSKKKFLVTEEYVKNFFVIQLNGIQKIWDTLVEIIDSLKPFKHEPFYENVFSYLDELIDEVNFNNLFKNELYLLNQE